MRTQSQFLAALLSLFVFVLSVAASPVAEWSGSVSDVQLEKTDDGFVRLSLSDGGYLPDLRTMGAPALPQKTVLFTIPDGAEVEDIAVESTWETLAENVRVEPVSEPVRDGVTPVPAVPDATIYNGTESWPVNPVRRDPIVQNQGARLLPVTVTPFRWNPVTGLLERASSLSVRVTFTDGEERSRIVTRPIRRTQAASLSSAPIAESGLYRTNPETNAFEYLLISPPDFYDDWCWYVGERQKTHPSIRFAVKNTAAIYAAYPFPTDAVRNAAESIHAYLRKTAPTNGVKYVVLGGAWLDAQNLNGYTPYFVTGEAMSLSNCVPGIYGFPRENWRQIPSDLFFGCLDMNAGQKYPWDNNCDGKYLDQNDCQNNDTYPDVCVSRITLNPHSGRATPHDRHALVTNYVAKLARGEDRYFNGHYRYGMSVASTGSSKLRKTGDRMYYRELEFYDDMFNMFDPRHHDSLEDGEGSTRERYFSQFSNWRPIRSVTGMMNYTWTKTQPTLAAAMNHYYASDRDFGYVQAHGWAQGAAQFSAPRFATATGLTLFNGGSGPCETGYPDYHVSSGGKKVLQFNVGDAAVSNPDGGALASVNNSRWSWAGGGGGFAAMSYYMLNEMLIGFNGERLDVGHAWLKGVRNYWPAGRWGNTAGWVLSEQFLYGDPLVRLPEVPNVWWTGGETGVWDRATCNWTNNVTEAQFFDAAYNVYFDVQTNLALDVTSEIAAMRLSIPVWQEDAVVSFAGAGTLKVMQSIDVAGTNTTLKLNVTGGVGHSGFRFLTGAGDLVFEGTNLFYVGGVSNARQIGLLGGGVTLDIDEFVPGNFPLRIDGSRASSIPLPNELRSKKVGGLKRFGPLAITNSYVKLATVDAFGKDEPVTHTLSGSTLEIAANPYYQRSGYPEGLNATFLVDGEASVTSSPGGLWTVKHETTFVLGPNAHLTLSAETVSAGGRIIITNAHTSALSSQPTTLVIEKASALSGDVFIGKGINVVFRELPLSSVTSLTIEKESSVVLPEEKSGYWQIVPVSSNFNCADDVTFSVTSDPDAPLAGSASKGGSFFKDDALYRWTGKEGEWNTYFANRHPKILFGDIDQRSTVTARVATAVSPEFAFFSNLETEYVFLSSSASALIQFSSIYLCGPTDFEVPVAATEHADVTSGTSRFVRVTAPYVRVAAGAGLALAGSHWTEFRLEAGAMLVAVPGATLDWNTDTSVVFPEQGDVLVDVGGLTLTDVPVPLISGVGHTWTLSDLTRFRLMQTDAEFRLVDGTLCVARGDALKGPYECACVGETNWNNAAWTAAGVVFPKVWSDCALDWSAGIVVSNAAPLVSSPVSLVLDCDVHAHSLTICAGTNDFTLARDLTSRATQPILDVATLDLADCHGVTDIAVDTGDAKILTASLSNGVDVVRLHGRVAGEIELSGVTLVLDQPGDALLATGAQGTLRVVTSQAYERFRAVRVPTGFENSGLTVEVIGLDGAVIDGFSTAVADGALWCVPPPLQALVPPGTNDISRLVWRDMFGNVVSNVDWTASAGFELIGTPTSGVVIAKSGFAPVWSRLSVTDKVTLYGNDVMTVDSLPGPGTIALAGAFTLKANVRANPTLLTGSHLELLDASTLEISHGAANFDATAQDWSGLTGTGRVRFTDNASTWLAIPGKLFAETLTVETSSDLVLTQGVTRKTPFSVSNLAGDGKFRTDWGSGDERPIRTTQTGVSAFAGTLTAKAGSRDSWLIVASDAETATTNKALVLSGQAVAPHKLDIETNGCVILTGSWKGSIDVAGLLVITDAAATNGVTVTLKGEGKIVEVPAEEVPPVTTPPAYVAPTYPDDPVTPDEPVTETRVRNLTAAVDGTAAQSTWTRLDWRDAKDSPVTEIDWSDVTNVTITATNGTPRILFDASDFAGVVHLSAAVTVEVRKLKPFTLAADAEGAIDFRLNPVPTATCDLLCVTSTSNLQPSTSLTVHDRYGRVPDVAGEVAFNAAAGKFVFNVQAVNSPTYNCTFDTQYEDSITSPLWFNGSGNLTYKARPELFEESRAGRALKGQSMDGFAMYSHNGNPTVGMDNVNVWSLHFVTRLPTNNGGIIFGWGNKDSGNGVALARVRENVAGVYAWENGGGARLVASANVAFASSQFHAYAITHDGTTLSFYVDGVLAQAVSLVGKYPTRGFYQWFKMYGQNGGLANGPTTVIDDFRLYVGTCLTPTSVRTIANDFPPWPEYPTAVVDVDDLSWSDLYWSGADETDKALTLQAGAGCLRFDSPVTVSNALSVTGGTVPLKLTGDGALIVPKGLAVASSLEIDASGLDGTNLASYAVANVPYARWLVRGAYTGPVSVTALPAVPDDYGVRVEEFAALGVRLVFTAPNHALADALGISVGDDSFASETRALGVHPTSPTNWHAYATWTSEAQEVGGLSVVGSEGGKVDTQKPYGNDTSVARYFAHTSFDGNNDTYNGKTNGLALSGLAARFGKYRVLAYLATDTANAHFGPVLIAGRTYAGVAAGSETQGVTVSDATALSWGKSHVTSAKEGVNVVVSDVLEADQISVSAIRLKNGNTYARGQIAAVEIVKVGEIHAFAGARYTADVTGSSDWINGEGDGLENHPVWKNDPFSTICLTTRVDNATLTFKTAVTAETFRVVSTKEQELTIRSEQTDLVLSRYNLSEALGRVTLSNDIPTEAVVDLGKSTVFAGAMNGTFGSSVPSGAEVRYAVPGLVLDVTRLKNGVTNHFASATVSGAVFDNARIYRVCAGDALKIRPSGDKGHQFNGHLVVEGGRLVLEPTSASDRFWYGVCGQASFTQTGGETFVNVTSEATSGNGSFLFGVSSGSGGTIPVVIRGGTFSVENSTLCCWLDVPITVEGTGFAKVKGLRGDGGKGAVTIGPGGALSVGTKGVGANLKSFALNGGLLTAHADAVTAMSVTLGADSTIAADDGVTHTLNAAVTGDGRLTIGTAERTGTVRFACADLFARDFTLAYGTLDVGSFRPTNAITRTGGKIKVRLTAEEEQTLAKVSLMPASKDTTAADYVVLDSNGLALDPDWVAVEDGRLTVDTSGFDVSKYVMPLHGTMEPGKAWADQAWYDSSVPSNRVPAVYWGSASNVIAVIDIASGAEVTLAPCVTNVTVTGGGTLVSNGTWPETCGLTIDAGTLAGADLAQYAVAGASYSHWIVKGPVTEDAVVTRLPALPSTYEVRSEVIPTHGVRLVVTANRGARFGSISVNLSGNGYAVSSEGTAEHGVHPIVGSAWNNVRPNSAATVTSLKTVADDGTVTEGTTTFRNHTAKEYDTQKGETLAILRGYHDDGSASEFTLEGIPFERYRLIVYYATDSTNLGFAGMLAGATSATAIGYYGASYSSTTGRATLTGAANTQWGSSNVRTTLVEGVNYLVTEVLTGGSAYVKSVRNGNGRATVAAIQVVKVGAVYDGPFEYEEKRLATKLSYELPGTTTLQAYDYVYHPLGDDDHTWEKASNWATAQVWQRKSGAIETNYTAYAGAKGPSLSDAYVPVAIVGREVTVQTLEGWNARYGLYEGAHLTVKSQKKFQSDGTAMFVAVDATSRMTIEAWGNASYDRTVDFYVAAPSGVVAKTRYEKGTAFSYHLTGEGSVCFENGFTGTHVLRSATIELGDAALTGRKVVKKYLVIGTGTVNVSSAVVTAPRGEGAAGTVALKATEVTVEDEVGTYHLDSDATGTYIAWVAHEKPDVLEVHPSATADVIPVATTQGVKIVCVVTNAAKEVKLDLTSAFVLEAVPGGVRAVLDPAGKVLVPSIGGAPAEEIPVTPEMTTVPEDDHVAVAPFALTDTGAAIGVKTIPGLTYKLMRGTDPTAIDIEATSVRATTTRLKLEDASKPASKAFYRVHVCR